MEWGELEGNSGWMEQTRSEFGNGSFSFFGNEIFFQICHSCQKNCCNEAMKHFQVGEAGLINLILVSDSMLYLSVELRRGTVGNSCETFRETWTKV